MKTIAQINHLSNGQGVKEIWIWNQERWEWQPVDRLPAQPGFLVVEGQRGYRVEDVPGFKVEVRQ